MNKFISVSVLLAALVAVASAAASSSFERETLKLFGELEQFVDYCLGERDFVWDDIKKKDFKVAADYTLVLENAVMLYQTNNPRDRTQNSEDVCKQFDLYEKHHKKAFEKYIAENPSLAHISRDEVQCWTVDQVHKVNGVCQFYKQ